LAVAYFFGPPVYAMQFCNKHRDFFTKIPLEIQLQVKETKKQ